MVLVVEGQFALKLGYIILLGGNRTLSMEKCVII